MIGKSLIGKVSSRYRVSVAEVDEQDVHQTIVVGVASIVPHQAQADSVMDDILHFNLCFKSNDSLSDDLYKNRFFLFNFHVYTHTAFTPHCLSL